MPFHVFLSHSSADKPAVEELARRLVGEGIQGWLDKWHLIPGDAWQRAIEEALAESETCAVFVGPSGFGSWQNEEMRAAIDRRVQDSGRHFRVIPVLLPGAKRAERSSLPTFLAATTWVEFHDSLDDAAAFHRLVCGIRGVEPGAGPGQALYEGQCPYRGLRVFDVDDAPFFFGREALVQWLLNEVRPATNDQPVNRFLAIVGASGSGKSSVARAGFVAALKHDAIPGSARWPVAICRPGPDPLESLAVGLSRVVIVGKGGSALSDLIAEFQKNEKTLHLIARQSLPENAPDMRLVVVVDQFEEVFTLCHKEELRESLVRNLLYAAKVTQGQTLVILTMRADFYAKCAVNAELAAALSDHHVLVGPMTDDELCRAIERPAQLVGYELEAGLVDLLLQDVRHQPGALPLLQHALLELWNKCEGRRLTVKAYQEIGKLEGALQRRADATLKAFSEDEQELCRRIFLRLTQPGEGTEDTKRRASMQELLSLSGNSTTTEAIVQRLTDKSLLTTKGDLIHKDAFVEVAHESLIRNWPQLRKWIETDRAGLRTRTRITESARDWKNSSHDPTYLYIGARLALAEEWAALHPGELSNEEAEFLRCCREVQNQREAKELETAQKLAKAQTERAEEAEKRVQEQKVAAQKLEEAARKLRAEREEAEDQRRIAQAAATTAEHALTDSFYRAIGISNQGVPPRDEREALWELAQLDRTNAAVRDNLLKRWFGTADAFMRGEVRGGQGFRALTGLNLEYQQLAIRGSVELGRRLVAALENPQETDSDRLSGLGSALGALAAKVEPQAAAEIAKRGTQRLWEALKNPQEMDSDRLASLGSSLGVLAAKMEPQAAAEIARNLGAALENPQETHSGRLWGLSSALSALAKKMEPQPAAEIAKGLGAAFEREWDSNRLASLGSALEALAAKMEPQAAAEIAKDFGAALENPLQGYSARLASLGSALEALAAKMEPQAAAEIAKGLGAALENPQEMDSNRLSSLSSALAALAKKMEPQAVAEIAKGLGTALENPQETHSDRLSSLGSALEALAAKMQPEAAAEIAKGLGTALDFPQVGDSARLWTLSSALAALVTKMEPEAAVKIARPSAQRLVAALENPYNRYAYYFSSLGDALAALAAKMEPQAAAEIAKGLGAALENPRETDSDHLSSLGSALAALARKMEPQAAAEIARRGAQRLAAALENPQQTDSDCLLGLNRALEELVAKMEPQAAVEIAKGLAATLENPQVADSARLSSLGRALEAVAAKMPPEAAAVISRRGAQRLAAVLENPQETDSDCLSSLGKSLAAFCAILPSAHHTHLLALSNLLLMLVPERAAECEEQSYDRKLLTTMCAQLGPQDLMEVLKYPFCTGEAEQIVLNQLETKTSRDFAGNLWKFAKQADSLGIKDIGSPAKRPSAQDALKELDGLPAI